MTAVLGVSGTGRQNVGVTAREIEDGGPGGVQVVARVANVLRLLHAHPGGLTQGELSDELDLPRTTVHRLIQALLAEEFVVPAALRGRYRLGPGLSRLARGARRELVGLLHPRLAALSRQLGETTDLAELQQAKVLFIDQVEAPNVLRAVSGVGASFPLHSTSVGKAALAQLTPEGVRRQLPRTLPAFTPNTLTKRADLERQVDEARETGVAWDHEEHTVGITSVATALTTPGDSIITIGVPMPTARAHSHGPELVEALLQARDDMVEILSRQRGRSEGPDTFDL